MYKLNRRTFSACRILLEDILSEGELNNIKISLKFASISSKLMRITMPIGQKHSSEKIFDSQDPLFNVAPYNNSKIFMHDIYIKNT